MPYLTVKVTPKSKQSKIAGFENGILKVYVHAPPEKGEANKEVIELLSAFFKLPKSKIILVKGQTSRIKTFLLEDIRLF